jgi:hypothetical protein
VFLTLHVLHVEANHSWAASHQTAFVTLKSLMTVLAKSCSKSPTQASSVAGLKTFASAPITQRAALNQISERIAPQQHRAYGTRSLGMRCVKYKRPIGTEATIEAEYFNLSLQRFGELTATDGSGRTKPYKSQATVCKPHQRHSLQLRLHI